MKVILIPEDFRNDQYVLKSILSPILKRVLGKKSRIEVCLNPRMGGITEVLKPDNLERVIRLYPMVDLFILVLDRDGVKDRGKKVTAITDAFSDAPAKQMTNVLAIEELETWILAGLPLLNGWRWQDIRNEVSVKEVYFDSYVKFRELEASPGGGRAILAVEAGRRLSRILQLCRDDIGDLLERLAA